MWLKTTASELEKACRRACGHMRALFFIGKVPSCLKQDYPYITRICRGHFCQIDKSVLCICLRHSACCQTQQLQHNVKNIWPDGICGMPSGQNCPAGPSCQARRKARTQRQANNSTEGAVDSQKGLCVCRGLPSVIFLPRECLLS